LLWQGFHAVPVKLKMLLDRLFSLLNPDEVTAVLRGFGWTVQDYQRGYILKVFLSPPFSWNTLPPPNENDQGQKKPCCFQGLNAIKCLEGSKNSKSITKKFAT
jgi:hypothetical protein